MHVAGAVCRVGTEVEPRWWKDRFGHLVCVRVQLKILNVRIEIELVHRGAFFRRFNRAVTVAVSVVVHVRLVHTVKQIVVTIVMRCVTSA